jgi:hypothetical protein
MRKNRSLAWLLLAAAALIFVVPLLAVSQDGAEAQDAAVIDIGGLSETPRGTYGNFGTFSLVHGGVYSWAWKNVFQRCYNDICYKMEAWNHKPGPSARPGVADWLVDARDDLPVVGMDPLEDVYAYRPLIVDLTARAIYGMKADGPGGRDRVVDFIGGNDVVGYSPGISQDPSQSCRCRHNPSNPHCNPTGFNQADAILFASWGRAYLPAGSGYGFGNCQKKAIGLMFNDHLVSPFAWHGDCNTEYTFNVWPSRSPALAFQCVGPVYSASGDLIWPEACLAPAESWASNSRSHGYAGSWHSPYIYSPFVFAAGLNVPVKIFRSGFGRVPTLRDFTAQFSLGAFQYRFLADGTPISDWAASPSPVAPILIPVGASEVELRVPPLVRFAEMFPTAGKNPGRDREKTFRAQIAVADTETGRWQVAWDSGRLPGDAAPPAVPVIRIRNPALARGPIVVRGVGGWWAAPSKIHVDWGWDTRGTSGIGPWEYLKEFGWCGPCSYWAEVRRVASLTGDFEGYFFWGGPKGHTMVGRGGLDFTGTAFQLVLVPVPYHAEVPPSVPAPQVQALELDQLQGVDSVGDSYGIPVDRPYRIGVRYQIPAVQATLVVTDEVGVQRIPVLLNTASMTSTLSYQTAGVSESRFFASAGSQQDHWLPQTFYAMGMASEPPGMVGHPSSGQVWMGWAVQLRQCGDAVVRYRFAGGRTQDFPVRVCYPSSGYLSYSGTVSGSWLEERR